MTPDPRLPDRIALARLCGWKIGRKYARCPGAVRPTCILTSLATVFDPWTRQKDWQAVATALTVGFDYSWLTDAAVRAIGGAQ